MAELLLCIDVGNSRTKFGLFRRDPNSRPAGQLPECIDSFAVPHDQSTPWRQRLSNSPAARDASIQGLVAASNPVRAAKLVADWPIDWPTPIVLDDVLRFPVSIELESPNKAGVDRILNAVACNVIRPPGHPLVIVDTGTATTVDAISPAGAFEGGAILPGFELCGRALHQYTALLPFITIDELIEESHEPLGRNTREALRSGLLWGQIGAIKELVDRLSRGWDREPLIVLTGGGAPLAAPHLLNARWEPHLSLQGMAITAGHLLQSDSQ